MSMTWGWNGIWFLVPLLWLFWARNGLPGPTLRFPRGPLLPEPKFRPCLAGWLVFMGLSLWASSLVWPTSIASTHSTLFLIDNSKSMAEPALLDGAKIGTRLDLGRQIIGEQLRLLDKSGLVGLVRFSSMPTVLAPLTGEREEIGRLLRNLAPESTPLEAQTNLVDALVEGLTRVLAVPSSHQRIVLWTDGEANVRATASNWNLDTIAEAIRAFGVELVILDSGPPLEDLDPEHQIRRGQAQALLGDLARASGGRILAGGSSLKDIALEPLKAMDPINATWRMVSGWFLALFGLFSWWYQNRVKSQKGALGRSLVWPNRETRKVRTFGALAGVGLFCGLLSLGLHLWHQTASNATKGILIDLRQGMLAGQPTRLERIRSLLEVALKKALTQSPGIREMGLWVMGTSPVCVVAPTKDWSALLDELPRLEAWAEDPRIWNKADPDALPLPTRGFWFWEGRGPSPFDAGLPFSWSIVEVGAKESALANRLGETRPMAGDLEKVQKLASFGRMHSLETCHGALARFLGKDGESGLTRFLWILGLLAFALITLFPQREQGILSLQKQLATKSFQAALAPTVCCLAMVAMSSANIQGQAQVTDWQAWQRRLEALSKQSPGEVAQGAKALKQDLDQLSSKEDPQWNRLYFLTRAALWRSLGTSNGNLKGPNNGAHEKEFGSNLQKGNKATGKDPFLGNPSQAEFPLSGQESPLLDGPLAGMNPDGPMGLWHQLNEAQKKVARETTTRRQSRVIQRPWDPPYPGDPK